MKFVLIIASVLTTLFLLVVQPGTSGVVASLRLPDGSEYMVTQRCNFSPEPYTVEFFMRSAGGRWGWCYIDHEANRWWNVTMTYDDASDTVVVTEGVGTRRAALNRARSTFWIDNGSMSRELTAPLDFRDPDFAFP